MLSLSDEDRKLVKRLRERRRCAILQSMKDHRLQLRGPEAGLILVSCGDGDQFYDIYTTKAQRLLHCSHSERPPRIHPITQNGGPLRLIGNPLDPDSVAPASVFARILLDDIEQAAGMKQIDTVALCVHAPCGYARAQGFGLKQILGLLIGAKIRVRMTCPSIHRVACFVHIDFGQGRKKTYFVSRDELLRLFPDLLNDLPGIPRIIPPSSMEQLLQL